MNISGRFWDGVFFDFPNCSEIFEKKFTWNVDLEYFLSRDFHLMELDDNRFWCRGGRSLDFKMNIIQ